MQITHSEPMRACCVKWNQTCGKTDIACFSCRLSTFRACTSTHKKFVGILMDYTIQNHFGDAMTTRHLMMNRLHMPLSYIIAQDTHRTSVVCCLLCSPLSICSYIPWQIFSWFVEHFLNIFVTFSHLSSVWLVTCLWCVTDELFEIVQY